MMTEQDFRRSLDAELSEVSWTLGDRAHVLAKLQEGGIPVKRKISTAFALALALMVLTVTAVAASLLWKDAGERIAPMESQGYYDTWSPAAKVELVKTLADLGEMEGNPDVERLLTTDMEEAEQDTLADQIMTTYVSGGADTVTLLSMLEKLHGPIEGWPMEDRVWYNDLLMENGMLTSEDTAYALPVGEELTQPQAVERAKAFLMSVGAVDLDTGAVETTMYKESSDHWLGATQVSRSGQKIWSVVFRGCASGTWHVDLLADGTVNGYSTPALQAMCTTGLMPGKEAVSETQAITLAGQVAMVQLGMAESDLADAHAYYGCIDHVDAGHAPLGTLVWQVVYEDGSRVMLGQDGSVLYTE